MPDIAMCKGTGCQKAKECYRHTAKPTPMRQSYFAEPPLKNGECEYFWPTVTEPVVVQASGNAHATHGNNEGQR